MTPYIPAIESKNGLQMFKKPEKDRMYVCTVDVQEEQEKIILLLL